MRILLLAPHPFFQDRGTPLAEKALLEFLSAEGHEVDVLTYHEGEDVVLPGCRIYRIPRIPGVRNLRPGFSVKKVLCDTVMFWSAARLMRRGRYHLVHAVEESVVIAGLLGKVFKIPYVYDMDSSLAEQLVETFPLASPMAPVLRSVERRAVRGSRGVIAVCRAVEDVARSHAPGAFIARIEDSTLLSDEASETGPALPVGGPTLMYVGNLEKYQGIDLLLEGFALAARQAPDARLVIVGGSPQSIASYRSRAAALGIGERVHWAGQQSVKSLGAYLRQADILVSPRLQGQNTPMKIYSYLDSGRPVLATRIPTHTQVLDDEIAQLVAPTPEAMAEGIVTLLRDPSRRAGIAARAKARVNELYTPAAAQRKLREFYHSVQAAIGTGEPAA
jgi:glycosyltransferase involved in cell wall biosynthesis